MWAWWFHRFLKHFIQTGSITVNLPNGRTFTVGNRDVTPVTITIHSAKTLKSLCLHPELAVGEAYMNGELTIENDDLKGFLEVAVRNIQNLNKTFTHRFQHVFLGLFQLIHQFNSLIQSRRNVQHHYDLTGELYESFLDQDRQYSCAYFTDPNATLEQAQIDKKNHIAKKLRLEPGMNVLDIGSGWGGLGLTLVKDFGARVMGITLSTEQHKVSNERAVEEGLADRVEFRLQDYRKVDGTFDRIVSVGMFEHVGVPHYREYFRSIFRCLKDDGVALLHTIGRSAPPGVTNPWLTKYIFPGGYVPALSETMTAIEKEGLIVSDVEVLRIHYAETLAHWYDRFMANIVLARELYDERFCRMWRFYLASCEMSFRNGSIVVFQIQLSKRNNIVPITRNYLYE